ncbi:MAG: TIGR03118 family protein [Ignavibacteriaceae bacterium]|nr:TIGR03118 family protein [Ignavibacteriaceae bacterium]
MRKKPVIRLFISFASLIVVLLTVTGCAEKSPVTSPNMQNANNSALPKPGIQTKFQQFNLVSDISFPGARMDPNLTNAWGLTVTPTGIFWISANHSGMSTIYDSSGNQRINPVTIPTVGNAPGGAPSGVVFNTTSFFKLPNGNLSRFIFAGEDGIISAWAPSSGSSATVVADQSARNAVYKGIELARNGSDYFLYATNFKQSKVDVFDTSFHLVNGMPFNHPKIPQGFAPFNIKEINGMLFITYALHKAPDNMDDQKGPGNGFIDIFTTAGVFVSRFASQGALNSPWGITEGFDNEKLGSTILIGNFGDGRINVFRTSGEFMGQVRDEKEKPVTIEGLWALFTSRTIPAVGNRIYFTAGPNDENDGLFGYLLSKHD